MKESNMLHSHIALALELISMTLSALLILKCCCACKRFYSCRTVYDENVTAEHRTEAEKEKSGKCKTGHYGFLKFIGYFTLILSFAGLICTSISLGSYWMNKDDVEKTRIHQIEDNRVHVNPDHPDHPDYRAPDRPNP